MDEQHFHTQMNFAKLCQMAKMLMDIMLFQTDLSSDFIIDAIGFL